MVRARERKKNQAAKATANANSTNKGGGRKSSTTAGSPPTEDAIVSVSAKTERINFSCDDLDLDTDVQKKIVRDIFIQNEADNIQVDLQDSKVEVVLKCFDDLSAKQLQALIKSFVPGYDERSTKLSTLLRHLRLAVFPAPVSIHILILNFNSWLFNLDSL